MRTLIIAAIIAIIPSIASAEDVVIEGNGFTMIRHVATPAEQLDELDKSAKRAVSEGCPMAQDAMQCYADYANLGASAHYMSVTFDTMKAAQRRGTPEAELRRIYKEALEQSRLVEWIMYMGRKYPIKPSTTAAWLAALQAE